MQKEKETDAIKNYHNLIRKVEKIVLIMNILFWLMFGMAYLHKWHDTAIILLVLATATTLRTMMVLGRLILKKSNKKEENL